MTEIKSRQANPLVFDTLEELEEYLQPSEETQKELEKNQEKRKDLITKAEKELLRIGLSKDVVLLLLEGV